MQIQVARKFVKIGPKKIRPIINCLRGCYAENALNQLNFSNKVVSVPVKELITSGIAAGKERDLDASKLIIKKLTCDDGPRLKRRRIRSRGSSANFAKKMCNLILILELQEKNISKKVRSKRGSKN